MTGLPPGFRLRSGPPQDDEVGSYITQAATSRGIDPNVALKVWESEGKGAWQSNFHKNGQRERSYGPYQLYMDGGLGNEFQQTTGLDPSDPSTWKQGVDFALDKAKEGGWGPWYGAKRVGITGKHGIGEAPQQQASMAEPMRLGPSEPQGGLPPGFRLRQQPQQASAVPNSGMTEIAKGGVPQEVPAEGREDMWESADILPLAINKETGERSLAVPGLVKDALNAAQLPGDVYSGKVDPNSEEGGRRAAEFSLMAVGGAPAAKSAESLALRAPSAAPKVSKAAAPSTSQLKEMANLAYKRADDAGLSISNDSYKRLAIESFTAAKRAGIDPTLHPKATAALKRVIAATDAQKPFSLQEMDTLRQVVKDAASSPDAGERRIAKILVGRLDDYMNNLTTKDVVAGDAKVAVNSVREARSLWSRMRKSELIDDVFEKAKNAAGPNYNQAGLETALRQKFRALLDNEKKMRMFTKEEQGAIRRVVRGAPMENFVRFLGKMAPRGVISGGFGLGVGTVMGPMVGGAAMVTGEVARRSAQKMTTRNAEKVSEMVRRGQ